MQRTLPEEYSSLCSRYNLANTFPHTIFRAVRLNFLKATATFNTVPHAVMTLPSHKIIWSLLHSCNFVTGMLSDGLRCPL